MQKYRRQHTGRSKVLHLITKGDLGGAQTHLLDLVSCLVQKFDISVAMGYKGPLWDELFKRGIPVYHVPSLDRAVAPVKDIKGVMEIIKLLKKVSPDLICTHSSKAGILGRFAARVCGVPVIFTAHGWAFANGVPGIKKQLYASLENIAARWTDRIICVSEQDRMLALKHGVGDSSQLSTVYNGIPILANEKYRAKPGLKDPVRLIMVARFSKQKDYPLFLQVLSEIQTNTAFTADLVGDGPMLQQCKQYASQIGITDKVNFLGSRTDVPELLGRAQVFVLSSNWEGFPISILEAMRAGLPVIASDVGGVNESVIDGETGILVPRGDSLRLKAALSKLIEDPRLRIKLGNNGHKRFMQKFTLEHMLSNTLDVYGQVLQTNTQD